MLIVGVDEVGRGCWAGPLVAGAVVLPADFSAADCIGWKLTDSKLLTKKQRETADQAIRAVAVSVGLGWVDAATIDSVGLTTAVKLAMEQALAQIQAEFDEVIIDGHINFLSAHPLSRALVRADLTVPTVSAASIVAKVARDNYMAEVAALEHPQYGFEKHVGYGTALHHERLKLHGVSEVHRRSFKPIQALLQ